MIKKSKKQNIIVYFTLLVVMATSFVFSLSGIKQAEAASEHRAVIIFSSYQEGNVITINAELKENKGLATLQLTPDYNNEYITLKNVKQGDALSQMNYLSSAGDKEDYSYLPFKMSWMVIGSEINDASIGTLLTFTFELDENTPDGNYDITLKNENNIGVEYFAAGETKPSSIIIGKTTISVKNGVAEIIEEEEDTEKEPNVGLIVGLSVGGAFLAGSVTTFIIVFRKKKAKKKKGWKKIDA